MARRPQCKAKSKQSGVRCKHSVSPGKKVCYTHGGRSPGAAKGNKRAIKHGFYSDALTDAELVRYEELLVKPNNIDEHIAFLEVKIHRRAGADKPGWSFSDWKTEFQQEFDTKAVIPGAQSDKPQKMHVRKTTHKPAGAEVLCRMLDTLTRMYWRRHQMLMDGQGDVAADTVKFIKSPFPVPDKKGKTHAGKDLDDE